MKIFLGLAYLQRLLKLVVASSFVVCALANAETYPARPIKILVGFPAGGTTDVVVRLMAQSASKTLGQPVVIENRPGAAGAISILQMAHAVPDGYTLGLITLAVFRSPVMQDAGYDPIKDISYIIRLTNVLFGVVVMSDSPWKTWQDFIAYAKENPNDIAYGAASGLGNSAHLLMEEVSAHERVKWTAVPFKGSADLTQALIGGHIKLSVDGSGGFGPIVDTGKARLLAVASEERSTRWTNIPTLRELGYNVSVDSPWGIGGPKGLPPEVIKKIHDAFKLSLVDPAVRKLIEKFGQGIRYMGPEDYTRNAIDVYAEQRALITKYGYAKDH